jgi:hypothetical protein
MNEKKILFRNKIVHVIKLKIIFWVFLSILGFFDDFRV